MEKRSRLTFLCFIILLVSGCFSSNVDLVKESTMVGYESTSVGKAFEGSFDAPLWTEFETNKGQKIVEFNGNISLSLHESASQLLVNEASKDDNSRYVTIMQLKQALGEDFDKYFVGENIEERFQSVIKYFTDNYYWKVGTPVKVQWQISNDGKNFEINSMSSDAWNKVNLTYILDLVYS